MADTRTKREIARDILTQLFANSERVAIADAVAEGAKHGVSRRTLKRACLDLGASEVHNGPYGGYWQRAE